MIAIGTIGMILSFEFETAGDNDSTGGVGGSVRKPEDDTSLIAELGWMLALPVLVLAIRIHEWRRNLKPQQPIRR